MAQPAEELGVQIEDQPQQQRAFRLQAINIFATWPQCPLTRPQAEACVKDALGAMNVEWCVVATEKHQDGSPHVHALIRMRSKKNFRTANFLDLHHAEMDQTWHGNYQAAKSIQKVLAYLMKTGSENVTAFGVDLDTLIRKKGSQAAQAAQIILDGGTSDNVAGSQPGFFLLNASKVLAFESYVKRRATTVKLPWKGCSPAAMADATLDHRAAVARLSNWINGNLFRERQFKQRQMWLWSEGPNVGKTTLGMQLEKYCRVYWAPINEKWMNDYEDGCYDLVIMDEFKGCHSISFLNSFVQGAPVVIPKKMVGHQPLKKDNVPVLVLANEDPCRTYFNSSAPRVATVEARFEVIKVDDFIELNYD